MKKGEVLRILNPIDVFVRECHSIHAARAIRAAGVATNATKDWMLKK